MALSEQAKQKRKAYMKKWRAEHKEQIAEYNKRYWEKKAEESADSSCNS